MRCPACGQENPDGFRFCGACGAPLAAAAAPREVRKVVTVVFCDLTGSTALGDVTDPETLRATMRGYYEQMRTILERHGGTVEKFIGDAVMAVFGVPIAHEDDALRAVRAAWEMRAAIPALGLRARIGVNTGEVVSGAGDALVTGDAVNVAARLEQAAAPDEVLIGPETRRLVRDAVRVEPVEVAAKGKPGPIAAFRLVDLDLEAAPIARLLDTPLVGRAGELEQLSQTLDRTVREQRCNLFTLLGPAGVGKSRLVNEFLETVGATVVTGRCLDYGEGITFWPVISVLKQIGARAETALTRVVEGATLPNEVFWTVRSLLEELAVERPLVVLFDDIQWGEETFLDLIDHIADLSRGAPILLLCVARPELLDKRPAWGGGKLNATTILLEPLSAEDCAELIAVHGNGGISAEMRERILAASDGNPLFVEEMVALARENGDMRVPATVQALLRARIDQLAGDERSVMERGAVEGQIFHRGALIEAAVASDVEPQLLGLVRKELILPTAATVAGEQAFRFRHLLIRDAAYEALPKETRAVLHERFATWLSANGRELIELDEILGYHLEQASRYHRELGHPSTEIDGRAGEHLAAAGRRAAGRDDIPAALNLLRRAAQVLPDGHPERLRAVLDRLAVLVHSAELDERLRAIEELERSDDPLLRMHGQLARLLVDTLVDPEGVPARAEQATAAAIDLFSAAGDERGLAAAWELRAMTAWLQSRAGETIAALDRFAEHAARGQMIEFRGRSDLLQIGPLVHGPFTVAEIRERIDAVPPGSQPAAILKGQVAEREGRYDEAIATAEGMLAVLQELGLPLLLAPPKSARASMLREQGRLHESVEAWQEVAELLGSLGQQSFLSTTLVEFARTRYLLGELDEAERLALEGEQMGAGEDVINFAKGRAVRALVAADRGDGEAAVALARSALDYAYRTDFVETHSNAHEALGYALRAAGGAAEARQEYERALELLERYGWTAHAARLRSLLVEL